MVDSGFLLGDEMRKYTDEEFVQEFWNRVDVRGPDDCWVWQAQRDRDGYGGVEYGGKKQKSHRVSYVLANGEIPNGLCVLHSCDNPPCCNPAHLFAGTDADNVRDREAKGRGKTSRPGQLHPCAKLSDDGVRSIRSMYASGSYSQQELAVIFGISRPQICGIVNHKSWTHVP